MENPPTGVMIRVIACLSPGWWRVTVGPGIGMLDGGFDQDWPEGWVPVDARKPNAEFYISEWREGKPQVIENGGTEKQDTSGEPVTDLLPRRIAWFAPWTWYSRWKSRHRWALVAGFSLIGYVVSAVPVMLTVDRIGGVSASDNLGKTVYLPLAWLEEHSPAARHFFQLEHGWATMMLGEP